MTFSYYVDKKRNTIVIQLDDLVYYPHWWNHNYRDYDVKYYDEFVSFLKSLGFSAYHYGVMFAGVYLPGSTEVNIKVETEQDVILWNSNKEVVRVKYEEIVNEFKRYMVEKYNKQQIERRRISGLLSRIS